MTRVLFASLLFVLWLPGRLALAQGEVARGSIHAGCVRARPERAVDGGRFALCAAFSLIDPLYCC